MGSEGLPNTRWANDAQRMVALTKLRSQDGLAADSGHRDETSACTPLGQTLRGPRNVHITWQGIALRVAGCARAGLFPSIQLALEMDE